MASFTYQRTNKVLLIYTGGTIGMGQNPTTGALEPLDFNHLVENLPEFKYLKTGIEVYQFASPIDSSDMAPLRRLCYFARNGYDGLHGIGPFVYVGKPYQARCANR